MATGAGMWRRVMPAMLAAVLAGTLTACGSGDGEHRQVVDKAGTEVTVLDSANESVYTKLQLQGIHTVDGVRGMDWLSEEVVAVEKENKALPAETVEGQQRYPHNLYLHDLSSGEEKPLLEGQKNYGFGLFSPDRKKLFYREIYEATGLGLILNLETGEPVKVSEAEFMTGEGGWSDDSHVIFPDMEGHILRADAGGQSETVTETGGGLANNVAASGTRIYYITGENGQLIAYDTETQKTVQLKQNVVWAIPSPDGSRLAVVKRVGPGKMTLVLCDSEGGEQSTLAEGQQIFGTGWSPDGSMLAYSVTDGTADTEQVFITEVESGEQTPVLDDVHLADPLRWSPSGKKLLASTGVMTESGYQSKLYIITLS